MPPTAITSLAYRILLAAVDLGWTPPAWRTDRAEAPFVEANVRRIVDAIETQRAVSAKK